MAQRITHRSAVEAELTRAFRAAVTAAAAEIAPSAGQGRIAPRDPSDQVVHCAAQMLSGQGVGAERTLAAAVAALIDRVTALTCNETSVLERIASLYAGTLEREQPKSGASVTRRHTQGSYFTPPEIVSHLLDLTLEPVLDRAEASVSEECRAAHDRARAEALLSVTVCDPACGVGVFLTEAARRIARRLHSVRRGSMAECLAEVTTRCIRGVDLDPVAASICRTVLSAQCAWQPDGPPSVHTGNAIVGSEPGDVARGIPDEVFRVRAGDDPVAVRKVAARNRAEAAELRAVVAARACDHECRVPDDAWVASFLRGPITDADDPSIVTNGVLARLVRGDGSDPGEPDEHLCADAERHGALHWHRMFAEDMEAGGHSVMIGNPPFLSQLSNATAASRGLAALLRVQSDGAISRYADLASAFLLAAARRVQPGGRIGFVLPASVMAGRDTEAVRAHVLEACRLQHLWLAEGYAFGCMVRPCALVLERHGAPAVPATPGASSLTFHANTASYPVGRSSGHAPAKIMPALSVRFDDPHPLSTVAASLDGVPIIRMRSTGRFGDHATVTADFRDQYYGLRGFIVEDDTLGDRSRDAFPKLVTSGTIDLAACHWGTRSVRFLGEVWQSPRVDRERMREEGSLAAWMERRCVPKLLLATQTRVLEVYVDARGDLVPSVPLITIVPHVGEDPWMLAAALAAPPITAHALRISFGAAMDARSIRLAAAQVAALPMPSDACAWRDAAHAFRAACKAPDDASRERWLTEGAAAASRSFGLSDACARDLDLWWRRRMTKARRPRMVAAATV